MIAQIYDLEKSAGVHALVMELVEGSTLADRIAQGPVPGSASRPRTLFEGPYFFSDRLGAVGTLRTYDVTADGQRFLMMKDFTPSAGGVVPQGQITVVLNWSEELRQRVPTN